LSDHLKFAQTPWERFVGFLDRKHVLPDDAIWFDDCSSVHTIGMRAPIDVIFLDGVGCVLKVLRNVGRNRPFVSYHYASSILEIGTSPDTRIHVGDTLIAKPVTAW
jgi:uncharacterized membrane protein (UPF0127 family)